MQIWNGSDEYCWRYSADTILSTDGQTDKVIPVYPPFNFVEAGGIINGCLFTNGFIIDTSHYGSWQKSVKSFVVWQIEEVVLTITPIRHCHSFWSNTCHIQSNLCLVCSVLLCAVFTVSHIHVYTITYIQVHMYTLAGMLEMNISYFLLRRHPILDQPKIVLS